MQIFKDVPPVNIFPPMYAWSGILKWVIICLAMIGCLLAYLIFLSGLLSLLLLLVI